MIRFMSGILALALGAGFVINWQQTASEPGTQAAATSPSADRSPAASDFLATDDSWVLVNGSVRPDELTTVRYDAILGPVLKLGSSPERPVRMLSIEYQVFVDFVQVSTRHLLTALAADGKKDFPSALVADLGVVNAKSLGCMPVPEGGALGLERKYVINVAAAETVSSWGNVVSKQQIVITVKSEAASGG